MTIGERIGIIAREKGLPLRKVAQKALIPYNTLYSYVARKSNRIDRETLESIANALDVEPWQLMGYDGSIRVGVGKFNNKQLKKLVEELNSGSKSLLEAVPKEYVLLHYFYSLNETGQKKAVENVEDLAKIPEYQKKDEPGQE